MHFIVGHRAFHVLIQPRPIIRDGQPCESWVDAAGCRILISCEVPREDRRKLLLHELRHCWTNEHGQPADAESDASSVASFTDEMLSQYADQGGDEALIALNPAPGSVPAGSLGRPIRDRYACGRCGADVMCGSILSDAPAWNAELACFTMRRGMTCPACDAITCWHEQAAENGTPLGVILANPAPTMLRGDEARVWIIEHEDRLLMQRAPHF